MSRKRGERYHGGAGYRPSNDDFVSLFKIIDSAPINSEPVAKVRSECPKCGRASTRWNAGLCLICKSEKRRLSS